MIVYRNSLKGVTPAELHGFFNGWPHPPSPEVHLRLLRHAHEVVLAEDDERQEIVGFVTAITDGVWAASIPLLEVKPRWRGQGIGSELMQRILTKLGHLYMIDLICDPEVCGFYERLGLLASTGVCVRRLEYQDGRRLQAG